jgi:osmotically-inducible protein OsmY
MSPGSAAATAGQAAGRNMDESPGASAQARTDADALLRAAVLRQLARSPFIAVRSVRCVVQHGVVTLRGRVSSFYLKQIALATVQKLEQVCEVCNEVEVRSPVPRASLSFHGVSPSLPR